MPAQIWTPLNPASRDQENLEGWLQKEPPLGRIGQASAPRPATCTRATPYAACLPYCVGTQLCTAGLLSVKLLTAGNSGLRIDSPADVAVCSLDALSRMPLPADPQPIKTATQSAPPDALHPPPLSPGSPPPPQPIESATSYIFLASQEAAFMTGQVRVSQMLLLPRPQELPLCSMLLSPPETLAGLHHWVSSVCEVLYQRGEVPPTGAAFQASLAMRLLPCDLCPLQCRRFCTPTAATSSTAEALCHRRLAALLARKALLDSTAPCIERS